MKEIAVSFLVDLNAEKVEIDLPLSDKAGKVQYVFWCRNGNERYLTDQGEKLGVDFLISFTCGLNSAGNISSGTLLTEDDAPIWHTRAQYFSEELIGKCGAYPEFGRIRNFKLRGFRLTPAASDVKVDQTGGRRAGYLFYSVGVSARPRDRTPPPGLNLRLFTIPSHRLASMPYVM